MYLFYVTFQININLNLKYLKYFWIITSKSEENM